MQTETNNHTEQSDNLSLKLASLQPKKRTANRSKFAVHYDAINDAINRGVTNKDIREALAEDGLRVSATTFKKLLEAERKRRERDKEVEAMHGGEA